MSEGKTPSSPASLRGQRQWGQYFTRRNVFEHGAFYAWAKRAGLPSCTVLEPFAGENSLIAMLRELDLCKAFEAYDIAPASPGVQKRDTLGDFPRGFHAIVTNPPYLAKNSATRRGIPLPDRSFDDLYKYALWRCLESAPFAAAIVPASFLNAGLFRERLSVYIALPYEDMFLDTEHPVCLALFEESPQRLEIYEKDTFLGTWQELEAFLPQPRRGMEIRFNAPEGNLGLRAVDNTKGASIAFVEGSSIPPEKVKHSSRNLTRIATEKPAKPEELNALLGRLREQTGDIFLTPFKGLREDGRFRRRLDFALARKIILSMEEL